MVEEDHDFPGDAPPADEDGSPEEGREADDDGRSSVDEAGSGRVRPDGRGRWPEGGVPLVIPERRASRGRRSGRRWLVLLALAVVAAVGAAVYLGIRRGWTLSVFPGF